MGGQEYHVTLGGPQPRRRLWVWQGKSEEDKKAVMLCDVSGEGYDDSW